MDAVGSAMDIPLVWARGRTSTAVLLLRRRPKEKDAADASDDIEPLLLTGLAVSGTMNVSEGCAASGSGMTISMTRSRRGALLLGTVLPLSDPATLPTRDRG